MKLSRQALQLLKHLKQEEGETFEIHELEKDGFDQAMVHRAAMELEEKGVIDYSREEQLERKISEEGEKVIREGSPEYRLLERLKEESPVELSELHDLDLDVALGKAREKDWVRISRGEAEITEKGSENDSDPVREMLENRDFTGELEERGLVETSTQKKRLLELVEEVNLQEVEVKFDVEARVRTPRTGKKHFYRQIIDYARQKWVEMGFKEMKGDFIVPSLLNFDALYTPQDHPARELQDTFFMKKPEKADISGYGEKVNRIRETHENGWETGSRGWNYEWSEEEARRNVLRTHTTAASAKTLHQIDIEGEELPVKYFKISRNFRNETVDRFHLAEFIQTEGIVVGEDLNYRHLKGYIGEFFKKMGYEEFRLVPSYYPYTELSTEVQVWDEEDREWVGLGGSGLFRPEVVKPLLGREVTVLAWGLGFGRIAMKSSGIEDIRELYRNDIEILEETPVWRPER